MKKSLLLLATLPLLAACNRVPSGVLSLADGSEAAPRVVDSNSNTRAERDLKRLGDIDKSIQASLSRLDAALDPNNTDPAHLEKLVVGDKPDPALTSSSRSLRQQSAIDQKFDEKNQALIDNSMSGSLDEVENAETGNPAPDTLNRDQRLRAEVDNMLDEKAESAVSSPEQEPDVDSSEPDSSELSPEPESSVPETSEPAPDKPSF